MKHVLGGLALAAVALAASNPASATTVIKTALFTPDLLVTVADFDTPVPILPGFQFAVTGAAPSGIYGPGLTPGIAAPPTGDLTKFYAVIGANPATNFVTFGSSTATPLGITTFRFDVSSLDSYNTISFFDKFGNLVDSFTGNALTNPINVANGDQFSPTTNLRLTFTNFSSPVATVRFTSSSNSFEFDNVGGAGVGITTFSGGGAPEPMTWAMLLAGFGVLGLALRSRGLGSAFAGAPV
jgi:hypothetical protein